MSKRATKKAGAAPLAPEVSAGTRRVFWAITLLIPFLFFALLEGGLRLGGYGGSYPLFEPVEGVPDVRVQSREVARRYFAQTEGVPNANADYFYAEKPEGSFRIIAQGGSSAAGFPYYWGAAFPRTMANRLRASYPGQRIDVVNTSIAAVNSYTLLDFADEIIEQKPDAVIIYAGHNEYYGALGAASAESFGRNPTLVRGYLALRRWRTVQLVRDVIAKLRGAGAEVPEASGEQSNETLMSRMVGEQSVPYGSELFEDGHRQFRENLDALLARYQAEGIPVFVGTLASNERTQRPFITAHAAGADTTAYNAALRDGLSAFARGDSAAALPAFRRATTASADAAEGHYRLAQALLASGEAEAAQEAFLRAKDLDALRFRAPEVFNASIREIASARGATVVESQDLVRERSPQGVIGDEMMLEHLHPTLAGYDAIADAFYASIRASGVIGETSQEAPPATLVRLSTPVDSLAGAIRVGRLTQSWPFRPDEVRPFALDTSRTPMAVLQIAEDLVQNKVGWETATDALADYYLAKGEYTEALRARQAMLMMYWFEPRVHDALAAVRMQMAQTLGEPRYVEMAKANYEASLTRNPNHGPALSMLGAIHLQRSEEAKASGASGVATQERGEAIAYLERARSVLPQDTQLLYNLAGAYALQGRWQDALRTVNVLLQRQPQNPAAQQLKASVLQNMG
ncbi:tetratricopeptide repeat protein [Rubricoccus marinus]|uniref:SGNH hydrolase-type esterase domain-containing protein n=1 Tax=Rubricoccus marinus TaxID=716817 RepID=A0A259TYT2_9BACT|nr:tetratricopeptide repeat protein [Rubricoccus marinus]OZC02909.1 hypothetical protein BSZ36_07945 [Rubricoccus marinus]